MQKALEAGVTTEVTTGSEEYREEKIPIIYRVGFVVAFIYLLVPTLIVVLISFNSSNFLSFPPAGFSLRWIVYFLSRDGFLHNYLLSLGIAASAALISLTIGTLAAIFLTRVNFPGRGLVRSLFLTPIMLPGIVLGLALYVFYLNLGLGLSRTLPGLIIGHVLVTFPFVLGTVSAALYNFDIALEESARSLGAGPIQAFFKVTLPIIKSGIMAGAIFAFIVSFGQFDISLFLSAPDITPLPIALYFSLRYTTDAGPAAAAAGTFAIFLVITSTLIISKLTNIGRWFSSGLKFH